MNEIQRLRDRVWGLRLMVLILAFGLLGETFLNMRYRRWEQEDRKITHEALDAGESLKATAEDWQRLYGQCMDMVRQGRQ